MSEVLLPEDIGRTAMITKVAAAVDEAMQRAGITDASDVHYVQTKTPLLTIDTIRDAKSRGRDVFTEDTLHSMDVPARTVRSAAGATRCWTIPTCTGTAGSRPRWVE